MLEYTTIAIEKSVNDVKDKFIKTPEFLNIMVSNCLAKYERSNDYLKKYHDLLYTYSYCGTCCLVAKEDTEKFKGYYFLAAEAGDICYRLCDMGLRTNRAYVENLKTRKNVLFYAQFAILANHKKLAIQIAQEDSLLGGILTKNYDKAKTYLPKDFKEIKDISCINEILWSIVYEDEKKMNQYFEKRIKLLRRQAKVAMPTEFDSDGLALIKLAQDRGMTCNLDVRELPQHLLDDDPVNEEEWRLPEDHELRKIIMK